MYTFEVLLNSYEVLPGTPTYFEWRQKTSGQRSLHSEQNWCMYLRSCPLHREDAKKILLTSRSTGAIGILLILVFTLEIFANKITLLTIVKCTEFECIPLYTKNNNCYNFWPDLILRNKLNEANYYILGLFS
jgi:hypothetical protein